MAVIVSKIVPLLITVVVLAVMMLVTMAVGWVSGKLIRRVLGIGGN
jgi:hypothetical protein